MKVSEHEIKVRGGHIVLFFAGLLLFAVGLSILLSVYRGNLSPEERQWIKNVIEQVVSS